MKHVSLVVIQWMKLVSNLTRFLEFDMFLILLIFLDLLELGSYTELQGGNIVLPTGYASILDPLRKVLPSESVILNCPVKTIKWKRKKSPVAGNLNEIPEEEDEDDGNDSDRTITDEPITSVNDGRVEIICDTNEVYFADHVIVTVPLGCLKDNTPTFEPKLPSYKLESIERLLFGTVDKIFLEYDRPFLNPDISEIMLLWDNSTDCNNTGATSSNAEQNVKDFWYKKIYSFSKINDTLLLGWISGQEAEYMETLDDQTVSDKCTEILRKFLKDPYVPKPSRCVR